MKNPILAAALLALCVPLAGCLAVTYSSGSGWHMWPGPLGLILAVLLVFFLLRRRR